MQITPNAIRSLDKGFSRIFQSAYGEAPEWGSRIATTVPSSHSEQVYGWMKRMLAMREWLGPRVIDNLEAEAYTIRNKTFEKTFGVPVNDIEDDNLGVYSIKMQELGRIARKWPDQQLKTVLQDGTSGTGFDGVAFFGSTHALNPAGNQSNNFTGTALTLENYATTREAMMSYTGEDGEPLGVMPNLLIVPPQLDLQARRIINGDLIGNAGGTAAESNVLRGSADVLVIPELANQATTWYLADVSGALKPLIWQLRQAPTLTSKTDLDDDNVFHHDQYLWGAKARGAPGYGPWWLMSRNIA